MQKTKPKTKEPRNRSGSSYAPDIEEELGKINKWSIWVTNID